MSQNKPKDKYPFVVAALCIVLAVSLTGVAFSFYANGLQNQIDDLKGARLVNVSLNYTDNQQGVIFIRGYVYNAGEEPAYENYVEVNLYRNDVLFNTAQIDLYYIPGATSIYVDKTVTYTGSPPTKVTLNLEWIQEWEVPVA